MTDQAIEAALIDAVAGLGEVAPTKPCCDRPDMLADVDGEDVMTISCQRCGALAMVLSLTAYRGIVERLGSDD